MNLTYNKNMNDNLKETKHIVAYLDILGVKTELNKNSLGILNKLNTIYDITASNLQRLNRLKQFPQIKKHIFSDNIIFAQEVGNEINQYQILNFLLFISVFLHQALDKELLIRGGITIGNLYINKYFVNGQALVRAYDLESKIAIYPRVVLDFDVFGWLSLIENIDFNILHGDDMLYCLDACRIIYKPKTKNVNYIKIKENILKTCKYIPNIKVVQKHLWLINQFNDYCDINNHSEYKINIIEEYANINMLVKA